jgi:hypothetical protein
MQALSDLELTPEKLKRLGIYVYNVAMSWPLDTESALEFAAGHEELLVVEEKRSNVEVQIKDALFHRSVEERPRVTGKTDERGVALLPEVSELSPRRVAKAVLARMLVVGMDAARAGEILCTRSGGQATRGRRYSNSQAVLLLGLPSLNQPFNIYITGVGGSGVLTMGALVGGAAPTDGHAAMDRPRSEKRCCCESGTHRQVRN